MRSSSQCLQRGFSDIADSQVTSSHPNSHPCYPDPFAGTRLQTAGYTLLINLIGVCVNLLMRRLIAGEDAS